MIPEREIKEKAREYGVPVSTIERDYAQNWLLHVLSSISMVLKGGTGIRKVYFGDYRFSDDLDFTLLEIVDKEDLEALIRKLVKKSKEESGINFDESIKLKENENGFEITVYFQVMQRGRSKTRIKLDLTKYGNEKILLSTDTREIIHPYSDNLKAKVEVYALEEIVVEKLRSLFQRTRPRDLYDVWMLWNRVDRRKTLNIFSEKCGFKGIEPDIQEFKDRREDFKNAWINSLSHQLKNVPDFEKVFSFVAEEVEKCVLI